MTKKTRYERLVPCIPCTGKGAVWDKHLDDYTIDCPNCVGEGVICGECHRDVITCLGETVCWEHDPDGDWGALDE